MVPKYRCSGRQVYTTVRVGNGCGSRSTSEKIYRTYLNVERISKIFEIVKIKQKKKVLNRANKNPNFFLRSIYTTCDRTTKEYQNVNILCLQGQIIRTNAAPRPFKYATPCYQFSFFFLYAQKKHSVTFFCSFKNFELAKKKKKFQRLSRR